MEEVPCGFVVLQVRVTLQLLLPEGIVHEDEETPPKVDDIEPDIVGLSSEHDAFVPPLEPLQFQVQEVAPLMLLTLVPEIQP